MWDYLRELRQMQNLTVVVTTHYIEEVESCDRVCIIDRGRILADGTPADLKAAHGAVLVRARPSSATAAAAIVASIENAVETEGGDLLLRFERMSGADALLAEFGDDLNQIVVHQPSLESVFLTLTGRPMPDSAPVEGRKPNGR
jgi:ABC-2 type transport system ATP-binding protein